jgi:hypothetical protein
MGESLILSPKMHKRCKLFDCLAIGGIAGFLLLIPLAVLSATLDQIMNPANVPHRFMSVVGVCFFTAFSLSSFVLWVRAWYLLFARWKQRTAGVNVLMLLLCMFIAPVAGFIMHFLHWSET